MMEQKINRREFMGRSLTGAAAAGATLAGLPAGTRKAEAADTTVGIVGAGIRGLELMQAILAVGGKVAIVCDLYDGHLRRAGEIQPNTPTTRDFSEVLRRRELDAVVIATSDHWHAPIALEAMKSGKDVYVEKPMTHTIPEALEMVKISKATGRLVQVGSQSLSMASTRKAREWVQGGSIGNVYMVQCSINRPSAIGAWRYPVPPDASPRTIDWERFLGNAPKRPFDAARFFQFRNWWDYGTGIAGDEYVHLLSRVHFCLNVQYPIEAVASGGIYKWTGDRDVPDIHNTLYDYGKFQVQVTANLVCNWEGGEIVRFMGDKGTVELTEWTASLLPYNPVEDYAYPLESWPKDLKDRFIAEHSDDPLADVGTARQQPQRQKESMRQTVEGTEDHMRNFLSSVKNRQQPVEPVEFGCGTAVACHMANTSYRRRRRVAWDSARLELKIEA
jgi:predicted dehydrogenase